MKIWQKGATAATELVDSFTVGRDRELDAKLAKVDILGSLAHTRMLEKIGLMTSDELNEVQQGLKEIYKTTQNNTFSISATSEDVHSEVEGRLTEIKGAVGGKIHSGRSRNDQVLLDLRLYFRDEIYEIANCTEKLFNRLQLLAEKHKNVMMPGYTHLQVAMPSSFGLWFGAYAESLADDLVQLKSAYEIINRNPLGSAAGYGSSFALDREMTSDLLGFESPVYNVVYAQMGRGKSERILSQAIGAIAATIGRFAMDNVLYLSQNFSFISYPSELTTGSSIMPHKKNPDVWEIMRGRCNMLQSTSSQVMMLIGNLPSGYHRELQLLKEILFPAIEQIKECLEMADYMLQHVSVKDNILDSPTYRYIFSVDSVNALVLQGIPFREAYIKVGQDIEKGCEAKAPEVEHTHLGSMGNLCLEQVSERFKSTLEAFNFNKYRTALEELLK